MQVVMDSVSNLWSTSSHSISIALGVLGLLGISALLFTVPNERSAYGDLSSEGLGFPSTTLSQSQSAIEHEILQRMLRRAENEWQVNMERRQPLFSRLSCPTNAKGNCGVNVWLQLLTIPTYPCPFETTLGPFGEGGKWLCNIPGLIKNNTSVVYSVGSKGQTDFEAAIYEKFQIVSHTFDPTLEEDQIQRMVARPYLEFHNIGWGGTNNTKKESRLIKYLAPGSKFMTTQEILASLNHSYVDVLKIDCEGCEVGVMDLLLKKFTHDTAPFGHILMEIHSLKNMKTLMTLVTAMDTLGYRLFHSESNILAPTCCQELAFIHDSLILSNYTSGPSS